MLWFSGICIQWLLPRHRHSCLLAATRESWGLFVTTIFMWSWLCFWQSFLGGLRLWSWWSSRQHLKNQLNHFHLRTLRWVSRSYAWTHSMMTYTNYVFVMDMEQVLCSDAIWCFCVGHMSLKNVSYEALVWEIGEKRSHWPGSDKEVSKLPGLPAEPGGQHLDTTSFVTFMCQDLRIYLLLIRLCNISGKQLSWE